MNPDLEKTIVSLITRPQGVFLVTGPTGSGKTTTLYGVLQYINTPEKNILTVEDPVEYILDGIGQIQVNPKIQLDFARALRSFLRQDPDVIMVGEVRDEETARIAIQAALTGHLVFSTLHTNDSRERPYEARRYGDRAVPAHLLGHCHPRAATSEKNMSLIAGRLYEPTPFEKSLLEEHGKGANSVVYKGRGCPECLNTGYLGRIGIFELLTLTSKIQADGPGESLIGGDKGRGHKGRHGDAAAGRDQ